MKIILFFVSCLFLIGGCLSIEAQVVPPGSSDKNLEDRDIKGRSIELQRVARDARKPDQKNQQTAEMSAAKFQETKEDFEQIQVAQNGIVAAYEKSRNINFAKISILAGQINKRCVRLKSNLFPIIDEKKNSKKPKQQKTGHESQVPAGVEALIVELDNTLIEFIGNPMFINPQVINSADNAKAQLDLERLIRLSAALQEQAERAAK